MLDCKPGGIVTFVKNPLGTVDSTQRGLLVFRHRRGDKSYRADAKETLLLRVCETARRHRGVDVDGYPRGEVVVIRDK